MNTSFFSGQKSGSALITLILFVAIFLVGLFYVQPKWNQVSALRTERDELTQTRQQKSEQLVQLQELQKELASSSEVSQETTLLSIPTELGQDELLRELGTMARENNMILNSLNFSIPSGSTPGSMTTSQINLSVVGSEASLVDFLRAVEASGRKMVVKNIAVQVGEQESEARVSFNLNIEVYYQGVI